MKQFWLTTILLFVFQLSSLAQKIVIKSIDDSNYPTIAVHIQIESGQNLDINKIILTEDNQPSQYKIAPDEDHQTNKTYYFLVENSYYFGKHNISKNILAALNTALQMTQPHDKATILWFGTKNQSNSPIRFLAPEPTQNTQMLAKIANEELTPNKDSSFIDNRLFESLTQTFDYIATDNNKDNIKVLNIICRGLNLSNQQQLPDNFFSSIQHSNISTNILMFDSETQNARKDLMLVCESTNGIFSTFTAQNIELKTAQLMEKISKTKPSTQNNNFIVKFITTQNNPINKFSLSIDKTSTEGEFTNHNKNNIFNNTTQTILTIAASILLIVILVGFVTRNKIRQSIKEIELLRIKEIQQQNKKLKKELEKYKRHPISIVHTFDNFNPGETLIGSGKIVPKILIENDGQQQAFELTKLVMTIGRNQDNDIVIPNRTISSRHCTISYEGGFFYITDNNSTNGVFVNDIRITKNKVHTGDIIRIGSIFAKLKY